MRLLMSFAIIVGLSIAAENVRPQCSMAGMTWGQWLQCLWNEFAPVVVIRRRATVAAREWPRRSR